MILENQFSPCRVVVKKVAQILQVSKSGYYKWLRRKGRSNREIRNQPIVEKIKNIIESTTGYGYRRITYALRALGDIVNHKRVLRLMRMHELIIKRTRFHPITTDSEHDNPVYPNLVRGLRISYPNQVWAADFTYIQLKEGFVYLVVEMDLYSRRIIGWSLSRELTAETALEALHMALYNRRKDNLSGLIHHSDRGVQFTSMVFTQCLRDHGIEISNSRKAYPYDNAFVESFFKTLKMEEVYLNEYENFEDALKNIKHFIEDDYNAKRMHSSLGYVSPCEFERQRKIEIVASS
jgi:transposase InsO family protein